MAGLKGTAQTGEVATGTILKTILQLVAPSNHRVLVEEISISFKGTNPTDTPINVQIYRQTTAGTMSSLTPKKWNPADDETLQATAFYDASAEPTSTDEVMGEEVHPQTGWTWQARYRDELPVPGGTRIGIVVTASVSVSCKARIKFEE